MSFHVDAKQTITEWEKYELMSENEHMCENERMYKNEQMYKKLTNV